MNTVNLFINAAVILAALATVSLLFKAGSIRGAGRIIGGFAWLAVGGFVLSAVNLVKDSLFGGSLNLGGLSVTFDIPNVQHYQWCGWAFVACGVITVASGVRKYLRRNTAQ